MTRQEAETERLAWTTPPLGLSDTEAQIDMRRLRAFRLGRVQEQLRRHEVVLALLVDPVSIRYASGFRSFALFQSHLPTAYLFVPAEGRCILHGGDRSELETIAECRPAVPLTCFNGGYDWPEKAAAIADQIVDLLRELGTPEGRVAVQNLPPQAIEALADKGVAICESTPLVERARVIKGPEELLCMNAAIAVAEVGIARMREALRPGMSEIELWSILHATNIAFGGDWIETRLLTSGDRTNPWLQEAGSRIIRPDELVAFDTDMIGPFGYCADISRTFHAGPGKPSEAQKDLYKRAVDELAHNTALVKPGLSFREFSEKAQALEPEFLPNRYTCLAHGVGMSDEYPKVYHQADWATRGYDGIIEEDMVLCIESYMGRAGGTEGVKLEQQVWVTADGSLPLSRFPFEDDFLEG